MTKTGFRLALFIIGTVCAFAAHAEGQDMAEAALRAVRKCAPYTMLLDAHYQAWQRLNITFDTRGL